MKTRFTLLWMFVLILSSCTNADPKKMANELCDCVKSKKQVGTTAKKIILKAAGSNDFQATLQEEMAAIDDETKREEIQEDITSVAMAFQGKNVKKCAESVDRKYRVSKSDEAELQKTLVDEMQNVDDCEVYAAFIRAGLKKQSKKAGSDTLASE
jgi:hypothetical protein